MINQEVMLATDYIEMCGRCAKQDLIETCKQHGIKESYYFLKPEEIEKYLGICKEVLARWQTTNKFKVGDKVYVNPGRFCTCKNYIRATITEVTSDWGYHLRTFVQDLPGLFMFNIWDKDLLPRTNKKNKPLSEELELI